MFECLRNSSYTQWWRQSSEKQSHTRQDCCLLSYTFNCTSVNWTFLPLVQRFLFFTRPGLHFFTDFHQAFSQWCILLQVHNFTVKIKRMMQLHVISPMSLQHNTSYIVFDWAFLEVYLNSPLTFVQSITQTTGKLFVIWMYWMMTSQFICCIETPWTFTASCRWTCTLRFCLVVNFMWQIICHTWTKYLHCVTAADVSWVDYAM